MVEVDGGIPSRSSNEGGCGSGVDGDFDGKLRVVMALREDRSGGREL